MFYFGFFFKLQNYKLFSKGETFDARVTCPQMGSNPGMGWSRTFFRRGAVQVQAVYSKSSANLTGEGVHGIISNVADGRVFNIFQGGGAGEGPTRSRGGSDRLFPAEPLS